MTGAFTMTHVGRGFQPMDRTREQDLVARACRGEAEAFGILYERLIGPVYRYIFFRVSDDATAEDLTSKVFLKAWEHLPHYKSGKSPFVAWLYTIARNVVIDHYRVQKPAVQLDEIASLASDEPQPDEQSERRTERSRLRRAMNCLTKSQQEVITLKLMLGLGTEETAKRLGKTPGAIRAIQMRALQSLAKALRQEPAVSRA